MTAQEIEPYWLWLINMDYDLCSEGGYWRIAMNAVKIVPFARSPRSSGRVIIQGQE